MDVLKELPTDKMVVVKESLKCQQCGSHFFDYVDGAALCVLCCREHDLQGKLIPHPDADKV